MRLIGSLPNALLPLAVQKQELFILPHWGIYYKSIIYRWWTASSLSCLNYISSPAVQGWVCNTAWGMHSLGIRRQPLSKHGGETNPLRNSLAAAELSFISRGRCTNNLQCFSLCLRIMQQCDSDGAPGTTSAYTGAHMVPSPPHKSWRACTLPANSPSLSLWSLFHFPFLSDSLSTVPPPPSSWQETPGQWSRLFGEGFIAAVPRRPTAVKTRHHSVTINVSAFLLVISLSPRKLLPHIEGVKSHWYSNAFKDFFLEKHALPSPAHTIFTSYTICKEYLQKENSASSHPKFMVEVSSSPYPPWKLFYSLKNVDAIVRALPSPHCGVHGLNSCSALEEGTNPCSSFSKKKAAWASLGMRVLDVRLVLQGQKTIWGLFLRWFLPRKAFLLSRPGSTCASPLIPLWGSFLSV